MMQLELNDIHCCVKSLQELMLKESSSFNISDYIELCSGTTRVSSMQNVKQPFSKLRPYQTL